MPAHVAHAQTMSGLTSAFENPQFSTAIGLIKYAQAVQTDRPRRGIGRIFGKLFQRNAMNRQDFILEGLTPWHPTISGTAQRPSLQV